jgi:hypothetical protein
MTLPAPRDYQVTLFVPANVELKILPRYNHDLEVSLSPEFEKYSDVISYGCNGRTISYSGPEQKFVCKLSPEELVNAREAYAIHTAGKNIDEIVTLKHSSQYYGNVYNRYSDEYSEWRIENILIDELDRKRLILNFSDRNLRIEASVRFVETDTVPQFSEFKFLDVSATHDFDEEDYRDTSMIQEYLRRNN